MLAVYITANVKDYTFNVVEAPFKNVLNFDVCVVYDDVQMDQ